MHVRHRLRALVVGLLLLGACKEVKLTLVRMTTGGDVCAAGALCTLGCNLIQNPHYNPAANPQQCHGYTFKTLSDADAGSTYYAVWWITPFSSPVAKWAGTTPATPIYIIPGIGLSNGYAEWLNGAANLADALGRPVALLTPMVLGSQVDDLQVDAGGSLTSVPSFNDIEISGANWGTYTWMSAYNKVNNSCGTNFAWNWVGNGINTNQVNACIKTFRTYPVTFEGSALKAIVDGWHTLVVNNVQGITSTTKFDILAHSAGGPRVAGAIANYYNQGAPYNTFYQLVRSVITLDSPLKGTDDFAGGGQVNDGWEFGVPTAEAIIAANKKSPNLSNVHWWPLAGFAPNCTTHSDGGNYLGGSVTEAKNLTTYCGGRTGVIGDGLVPLASQFSPYANTHGSSTMNNGCLNDPVGTAYIVSGSASFTSCSTPASDLYWGAPGLGPTRNGVYADHTWYLESSAGQALVVKTLLDDCAYFGTNCAGASGTPCYSGAAATENVGVCHAGTKYPGDATCYGQVTPKAETCNGYDDNCDGIVDNGAPNVKVYQDLDHDNHGTTAVTQSLPCDWNGNQQDHTVGWSLVKDDCDDSSSDRFPGQKRFFTLPTSATSSFDYNCDGMLTPQFPNMEIGTCSVVSCGINCWECTQIQPGWQSSVAACGVSANYVPACAGTWTGGATGYLTCNPVITTFTQACQ